MLQRMAPVDAAAISLTENCGQALGEHQEYVVEDLAHHIALSYPIHQ